MEIILLVKIISNVDINGTSWCYYHTIWVQITITTGINDTVT